MNRLVNSIAIFIFGVLCQECGTMEPYKTGLEKIKSNSVDCIKELSALDFESLENDKLDLSEEEENIMATAIIEELSKWPNEIRSDFDGIVALFHAGSFSFREETEQRLRQFMYENKKKMFGMVELLKKLQYVDFSKYTLDLKDLRWNDLFSEIKGLRVIVDGKVFIDGKEISEERGRK